MYLHAAALLFSPPEFTNQWSHHQRIHHLPLPNRTVIHRQAQQRIRPLEALDTRAPLSTRTARMQPAIAPDRHQRAVILRPLPIAPDIPINPDPHLRQARRRDTARAVQARKHEQLERRDGAGRVTGEREDDGGAVAGAGLAVFEGDRGEGGWFAGFHRDAAEVDGAAEGALDGWFEQVELAHGDTAAGDDEVDATERAAQGVFEGAGSARSLACFADMGERESLLV